jgi:hypothetical protein
VQAWLKGVGHARGPLEDDWTDGGRARALSRAGFPRRPRIVAGDHLVYYASVWRCVFAVMEVTGDPDTDHPSPADPARWPWSVPVRPLVVVGMLSDAVPVEAIGVAARSMSQQSHIRLTERQYELAVEVLASAGAD